jgi:hypothetical protein
MKPPCVLGIPGVGKAVGGVLCPHIRQLVESA